MLEERINLEQGHYLIKKPNICAHCRNGIDPILLKYFECNIKGVNYVFAAYECSICEQVFFAKYYLPTTPPNYMSDPLPYFEIIGGKGIVKKFDVLLDEVSPDFIKIYNDTYKAEQAGCTEILGLGYRRSFEFLIKDYAIKCNPSDEEKIKSMPLSDCINKYTTDKLKKIVSVTSWIGNDFSHYESKHENINIDDLKELIRLSVNCLVDEIKIKEYISKINRK